MNATQTLIMNFLTNSNSYHTVKEIQAGISKGETTVRENLKVLLEQGDVSKDGKLYTNTPIVPEDTEDAVEHAVVVPQDEAVGAALDAIEPPAKKVYRRHATPTTRTIRINQITGYEVQVLRGDEYLPENPPAKWVTICLEHDTIGESDLVLDAHFLSTYPTFCPSCAPKLEGKVGRRRTKKA